MKKVVLIPDSFKGTMSSAEICDIMAEAVLRWHPGTQVVRIPVADGGEGSVDALLTAMGGERIPLTVSGPYGEPIESFYGILSDGSAIVEMAAAAGLPLVGENRHAEQTTTYGVGELIAHAVRSGCRKVIVGLGGSATNDGGCGVAAALGVRFYRADGSSYLPVGGTLNELAKIDMSGLLPELAGVEIVTMCDIDNPLCGPNGAAMVFSPQKGADPETARRLDENLRHLANVIERDCHVRIGELPGAGAAGGMGGGMVAFLSSRLQMGIETVLDTVNFDRVAQDADFVFSGEGKLDTQSLRGKVVIGVARRTKRLGVPLIAVVGDIGDDIQAAYDEGVSAVFSINRAAIPFSEAKLRSRQDLALTMDNLMRFLAEMQV